MRSRVLAYMASASALLFCCGVSLRAQSEVSVQFTGSYTTTWGNSSGDYGAGIYGGVINGNSSPGIICDDFNDDIYSGESWKANAYQASQLTATDPATGKPYLDDTLFGSTIGFNGYAEMAMLVSALFNGSSTVLGIGGLTQAELASVIWDIGTGGKLTGLDLKALSLYAALQLYFVTHSASAYLNSMTNLWILTPDPKGVVGEPQEMWTENLSVPEGGAALLYLLIAGFSCFGGLLKQRRALEAKRVLLSARAL
jgi:hypothetical protein